MSNKTLSEIYTAAPITTIEDDDLLYVVRSNSDKAITVENLKKKITSTRVIYASGVAALDSDIDTGGGTDDTAAIQAVLDTARESNPLMFVLDGVALVTNLQLNSYTTLYTPQGCGLFQLADSDTPIILNANPRNHLQGPRIDRHISVIGGVFNCNGNNQRPNWINGTSLGTNWFSDIGVCGFAMYGVSNVILRDMEIRNARFFNYYIANIIDLDARNIRCFYAVDSFTAWGIGNTDGFHVRGGQPAWTASGTASSGDATVTVSSTALLYAGLAVSGTGIPAGAVILSITNATTFELTDNATTNGSRTLTFTERETSGLLVDGLTCINNHDDPLALDCCDPGFDNPTNDPAFQPGNGYGSLIDSSFLNINCIGTPSSVRLLMDFNRPEFTINNVLIENVNGGSGAMIFDGPVGNVTFRHIRDVGYIDCDNFTAEQLVFDDVHIDQLNAARFIELNTGSAIDDLVLNNVRLTHTEATNAAFLRVSAGNTIDRLTISNSFSASSAPVVNNEAIGTLVVNGTITPAAPRTLAGLVSGSGTVGEHYGDYFLPKPGVEFVNVADETARLALEGYLAGTLAYERSTGKVWSLWFAGNPSDNDAWLDHGVKTLPTIGPGGITSARWWADATQEAYADDELVGTMTDWSGNGFHGVASGSQRPTFKTNIVSSESVFRLNGTTNTIRVPQLASGAEALVIMVVARFPATPSAFAAVIEWGTASVGLRSVGAGTLAQIVIANSASASTASAVLDNWHVYRIVTTATDAEFFVDGVSIGTATAVPDFSFPLYIGSRQGSSQFGAIDFGAGTIFSDTGDIAAAEAALAAQFGIPI